MSHPTPIVFVVDDDISVRESLELLIRNAGWQPELLATAQEFLARPRVVAPSCLVLDVSLPGLNGLDLQQRIAADRKSILVDRIVRLRRTVPHAETIEGKTADRGVAAGKKSLALEVTLQPREKTLTDQEIDAVAAKVIAAVGKATGGEIRT